MSLVNTFLKFPPLAVWVYTLRTPPQWPMPAPLRLLSHVAYGFLGVYITSHRPNLLIPKGILENAALTELKITREKVSIPDLSRKCLKTYIQIHQKIEAFPRHPRHTSAFPTGRMLTKSCRKIYRRTVRLYLPSEKSFEGGLDSRIELTAL